MSTEEGLGEDSLEIKSTLSLNEALKRQSSKRKYPEHSTHIPRVRIRMEDGVVPSDRGIVGFLGRAAIRSVLNSGRRIFKNQQRLRGPNAAQKKRTEDFKLKAIELGLRGITSADDGFDISVAPSYAFGNWNKPILKDKLGAAYDNVVTEGLEVKVTLPKGQRSDETPLSTESLRQQTLAFYAGVLSCSEEEIGPLVEINDTCEVNTELLGHMIAHEQIDELPAEAGSVTETWSLKPRIIAQSDKRK